MRGLLWKYSSSGGFEDALTAAQQDYTRDPRTHTNDLPAFNDALGRMFADMNEGYVARASFEFQSYKTQTVGEFLSRFNVIFSLNQDLLIEHYYMDCQTPASSGKWNGSSLPGMTPSPNPYVENPNSWSQREWNPQPQADFKLDHRLQPYIKLHGSSNWRERHGGPMLIMGGNKKFDIGLSPVLMWYHEFFEKLLTQGDTRLMIIGYGFRDEHINKTLINAISNHGLKVFIISPQGADIAMPNKMSNRGLIRARTELEVALEQGLIGGSRRTMHEIFGGDPIEFNKVMRFFG